MPHQRSISRAVRTEHDAIELLSDCQELDHGRQRIADMTLEVDEEDPHAVRYVLQFAPGAGRGPATEPEARAPSPLPKQRDMCMPQRAGHCPDQRRAQTPGTSQWSEQRAARTLARRGSGRRRISDMTLEVDEADPGSVRYVINVEDSDDDDADRVPARLAADMPPCKVDARWRGYASASSRERRVARAAPALPSNLHAAPRNFQRLGALPGVDVWCSDAVTRSVSTAKARCARSAGDHLTGSDSRRDMEQPSSQWAPMRQQPLEVVVRAPGRGEHTTTEILQELLRRAEEGTLSRVQVEQAASELLRLVHTPTASPGREIHGHHPSPLLVRDEAPCTELELSEVAQGLAPPSQSSLQEEESLFWRIHGQGSSAGPSEPLGGMHLSEECPGSGSKCSAMPEAGMNCAASETRPPHLSHSVILPSCPQRGNLPPLASSTKNSTSRCGRPGDKGGQEESACLHHLQPLAAAGPGVTATREISLTSIQAHGTTCPRIQVDGEDVEAEDEDEDDEELPWRKLCLMHMSDPGRIPLDDDPPLSRAHALDGRHGAHHSGFVQPSATGFAGCRESNNVTLVSQTSYPGSHAVSCEDADLLWECPPALSRQSTEPRSSQLCYEGVSHQFHQCEPRHPPGQGFNHGSGSEVPACMHVTHDRGLFLDEDECDGSEHDGSFAPVRNSRRQGIGAPESLAGLPQARVASLLSDPHVGPRPRTSAGSPLSTRDGLCNKETSSGTQMLAVESPSDANFAHFAGSIVSPLRRCSTAGRARPSMPRQHGTPTARPEAGEATGSIILSRASTGSRAQQTVDSAETPSTHAGSSMISPLSRSSTNGWLSTNSACTSMSISSNPAAWNALDMPSPFPMNPACSVPESEGHAFLRGLTAEEFLRRFQEGLLKSKPSTVVEDQECLQPAAAPLDDHPSLSQKETISSNSDLAAPGDKLEPTQEEAESQQPEVTEAVRPCRTTSMPGRPAHGQEDKKGRRQDPCKDFTQGRQDEVRRRGRAKPKELPDWLQPYAKDAASSLK